MADSRKEELQAIVRREAATSSLNAPLIEALITVESAWNPWAMRLEPSFAFFYDVTRHAKFSRVTEATERMLQRTSFGLMQIMGATARQMGFVGPLATLLDPEVNVHWGGRYLSRLGQRWALMTDQIAAYNAGAPRKDMSGLYVNQSYVERVSAALAEDLSS